MPSQLPREVFERRAAIVRFLRRSLDAKGFLEVETPMMQTLAGGAVARPFVTHHNALGLDLFLRIAPELYLKRLVVGGMPRVYEINRNFRNEGISTQHNPEFTMLEFYQAYATWQDLLPLVEEMIGGLARALHGKTTVQYGEHEIDLGPGWRRLSLIDSASNLSARMSLPCTSNSAYSERSAFARLPRYGSAIVCFGCA